MAAKKSTKKRSSAKKEAAVKSAAKYLGVPEGSVKALDKHLQAQNKRPLSYLANAAKKTEENLPKLKARLRALTNVIETREIIKSPRTEAGPRGPGTRVFVHSKKAASSKKKGKKKGKKK